MKKIYLLITLLSATTLFAQNTILETPIIPSIEKHVNPKVVKRSHLNKAPGDTLWYEDFGGGLLPNGWVSTNPTLNGFNWIYTTAGPGGQYSSATPPINSVTSANGFISLPSDFYNTPIPISGYLPMNSFITSGPIVINSVSNVLLKWRQAQRYCCTSTEQLELQVSTDGVNFSSFDAKFGKQANAIVTEDAEVNISSVAANQDTIYLRFFQSASHYYWMIDDIAIVEGPNNQLEITEVFTTFGSDPYEGYYARIPYPQTQSIGFGASIRNASGFDETNVDLEVTISHNALGQVFNDSSSKVGLITAFADDTFNISTTYGNQYGLGMYTANLIARSDTISVNPALAQYAIPWTVSDTVFAKDFGNAGGVIGPGSYLGGDNDGSMVGTKYTLKRAWPVTSLSYYIANTVDNVGVEIKAKVWGFDTTQATLDQMIKVPGLIAQNPIPYVIQQADLGTWLTLAMFPPVLLPIGQYVASIEQSGGNISNQELRIGRATDIEGLQPYGRNFSSFVYANDSTPVWENIFAQPMIRMNLDFFRGVNENRKFLQLDVIPNPSNGQFTIRLNEQMVISSIHVYNVVGKQVQSLSIGETTQQIEMDLNELDKGVYFLQINSEQNRVVEKIVIQ